MESLTNFPHNLIRVIRNAISEFCVPPQFTTRQRNIHIVAAVISTISSTALPLYMHLQGDLPPHTLWFYLLFAIVTLTIPISPKPAISTLIILFNIATLSNNGLFASSLFCTILLGFALLVYNQTNPGICITFLMCTLTVDCYQTAIESTMQLAIAKIFNNLLYYAAACCIPLLVLQQEKNISLVKQQQQMDQQQQRIEHLQHNAAVANALHDSTTEALSYIVIASEQISNKSTPIQSDLYHHIQENALKALAGTRDAIRTLSADTESDTPDVHQARTLTENNVSRLLHEEQTSLINLGFRGDVAYQGTFGHTPSKKSMALTTLLIKELFANILRHADPNLPYTILMIITDEHIIIHESNTSASQQTNFDFPHSGYGIHHFSQQIENIGGTLHTNQEDRNWLFYTKIPY